MSESTPPIALDDQPQIRTLHLPNWFLASFLDLAEDLQNAACQGKRGLILYFGQENCAYCEQLLQINWTQRQDIVAYTQQYFAVVALDLWGSLTVTDFNGQRLTERKLAEQLRIQFTPSLIFYDLQARELFRLTGYYPPYQFRAALDYVVGQYYRQLRFQEYIEQAEPPLSFDLNQLTPHPIFATPPYDLTQVNTRAIVVFFEQAMCHACDWLHSQALQQTEILQQLAHMTVIQLDRWADTPVTTAQDKQVTARTWADQLAVVFTPTVVFFDPQGQEIIRLDAVIGVYRLEKVLEYVLTGAYQHYPNFQRWHAEQQAQLWYQTHPVLGDY